MYEWWRTLSYYSLQADDVGVVELGHDRRLGQEVSLLLVCVSCLQGLQGHWDVSFPREPHTAVTHLPEFPYSQQWDNSFTFSLNICVNCTGHALFLAALTLPLKGPIQCPLYHQLIWFLGVLMKCL